MIVPSSAHDLEANSLVRLLAGWRDPAVDGVVEEEGGEARQVWVQGA